MERSKKDHKNKKRNKTSTRLQKHAPPALHLDATAAEVKWDDVDSASAIPFLSPLLLSPIAPFTAQGKELEPDGGTTGGSNEAAEGGWKHPAVGVMTEPSKLSAVFQAQCMVVNNVV
ncbi:hypothetical protein Salat_2400100 [Sesamum alatum]|uniref:Uncharacterized protein n=1 Tax=Sesamum alatum TaxID=300844 RepID=A0AAE1XXQ5_9LAMI|nr:hypothetical protein Salat_2400100 [Sesamum alatum]